MIAGNRIFHDSATQFHCKPALWVPGCRNGTFPLRDRQDQTIFALSSGKGRAGVAIIRVTGSKVRFAVERIAGSLPSPRRAVLRTLRDETGLEIDTALVLFFEGPHSFTGEDCAEFHVHGGRAVVAALTGVLQSMAGCIPALAGEFTRRALENGKLDLVGAESLADLVDADTEAQRKLAIEGQSGRLQVEINDLRAGLLHARALIEASLDFSDEGDVPLSVSAEAARATTIVMDRIDAMLRGSIAAERLRDGLKVVLAGPVNAGKSTLLNALAGRDVAIVSDIPGTTRDRLDVHLDLRGWPVTLMDTAGLRRSDDLVEQQGIDRTLLAVREADLVLWLIPPDGGFEEAAARDEKNLWIRTKIDSHPLYCKGNFDAGISARENTGLDGLLSLLEERAERLMDWQSQAPLIANQRQKICLLDALGFLKANEGVQHIPTEVLAERLRLAAKALSSLLGDMDSDVILGEIFARFCIGK